MSVRSNLRSNLRRMSPLITLLACSGFALGIAAGGSLPDGLIGAALMGGVLIVMILFAALVDWANR